MALIIELCVVFALAATAGLIGRLVLAQAETRARKRFLVETAHYAVVIGLAVTLSYFVLLVVTDVADLRPEPPA